MLTFASLTSISVNPAFSGTSPSGTLVVSFNAIVVNENLSTGLSFVLSLKKIVSEFLLIAIKL